MANQTATAEKSTAVATTQQQVPVVAPKSVLIDMADRYGMEPAAFEQTLRNTVLKPDKDGRAATREEFAAFLLVAKEYSLNPLTKEIYGFATKGGGIQPIVSIDGWANLINSHPAFDGMEFSDQADGNGSLVSITCKMFRKDRSHAISATEYMAECKRPTEPWNKWPRRMLRHKSMIQAARYAFGFAGIYDPDEGERMKDVTPAARVERRQLSPRAVMDQYADAGGNVIDHDDVGEVLENHDHVRGTAQEERVDATTGKTDPISTGPMRGATQEQAGQDRVVDGAGTVVKDRPTDTAKTNAATGDKPAAAEGGAAGSASDTSSENTRETSASGVATTTDGAASTASSDEMPEDEGQVDGADRPWPHGTEPTDVHEYERYLRTWLPTITVPGDVATRFNSPAEKALRLKCECAPRFKELQNIAIARRQELA